MNNDVDILSTRDKVNILETEMKKAEQVELKVNNYFSYGVYARELFIPKGIMLTGEIHKYPQLNIMTKGELSVLVDNEIIRIKAPFIVSSPAGTKRIAYAHEDTIWITIHGTHETDVDKIKNTFIAKDENDFIEFTKQFLIGTQDVG